MKATLFTKSSLMRLLALSFIFVIAAGLLGGCSSKDSETTGRAMAPMADMPAEVQKAPATVREAYQFAVANPELVSSIPCYCGCGAAGHASNYACYVKEADASGKVTEFDQHALGCSICVDITRDAMRLQGEGKTTPEIRAYIDDTYGKYGPSNMP